MLSPLNLATGPGSGPLASAGSPTDTGSANSVPTPRYRGLLGPPEDLGQDSVELFGAGIAPALAPCRREDEDDEAEAVADKGAEGGCDHDHEDQSEYFHGA